jgi:hypothetical protein
MRRVLAFAAVIVVGGCGSGTPPPPPRRLALVRAPDLGVACRRANSIRCDRVKMAVWLRGPVRSLTATIDGRTFRLHRPRSREGYWEGTLTHAGLLTPGRELHVTPDRGRYYWAGRHPVTAVVRLRTKGPGPFVRSIAVALRPGYG